MPTIISSALTFLDTTDQNQLSAYLTSNFATVQTCTSDKKVYSPSWESTPLEIQLHALYDGLDLNADKLKGKVTWSYMDGNEDAVKIFTDDKYDITDYMKLIVKKNVLQNCNSDTITFICEIKYSKVDVMTVQMTYTLISDAKAVSFYLGMPGGDTFTNQLGTREIIAYAYRGVEEIEAGGSGDIDSDTAKFTWYKYNDDGDWEPDTDDVDDDDPKRLTIQGTSVTNIASFKCVMKYKGVEYIGVATVRDISDTYISEIFTIGGDVFKNGIGGSAAYVIVRKNGQATEQVNAGAENPTNAIVDNEIDPLKGDISVAEPVTKKGGFWYKINNKEDKIEHYYCDSDYGPWKAMQSNETISQDLEYEWTLMDENGHEKLFSDGSEKKTGKVIYVSCNDIDNKGTVQCAVFEKPKAAKTE